MQCYSIPATFSTGQNRDQISRATFITILVCYNCSLSCLDPVFLGIVSSLCSHQTFASDANVESTHAILPQRETWRVHWLHLHPYLHLCTRRCWKGNIHRHLKCSSYGWYQAAACHCISQPWFFGPSGLGLCCMHVNFDPDHDPHYCIFGCVRSSDPQG